MQAPQYSAADAHTVHVDHNTHTAAVEPHNASAAEVHQQAVEVHNVPSEVEEEVHFDDHIHMQNTLALSEEVVHPTSVAHKVHMRYSEAVAVRDVVVGDVAYDVVEVEVARIQGVTS